MIRIIVVLSAANVLRWHSTIMNRTVVNKNQYGAGLHTKLGKRNDEYNEMYGEDEEDDEEE